MIELDTSIVKICSEYGIPQEIADSYIKKGLNNLYQWQVECIKTSNVLNGDNLVYCAPTGGGKTLIAELSILKTAVIQKRKSMLILPFVSLVIEKEKELKHILRNWNKNCLPHDKVKIKGIYGDSGAVKITENILICTIEKANSVLNTLISNGKAWQLGCVIVDEMHVLGDATRGYFLEIFISKLKYLEEKYLSIRLNEFESNHVLSNALKNKPIHFQLIALSATMSNVRDLASWFHACLYTTTFRPVILHETVVCGNKVYDPVTALVTRTLNASLKDDVNDVVCELSVQGLVNMQQQILVFCSSRNMCEQTIKWLTDNMPTNDVCDRPCQEDEYFKRRVVLYNNILKCEGRGGDVSVPPRGMMTAWRESIVRGMIFHHAGMDTAMALSHRYTTRVNSRLSSDVRAIIEEGFKDGVIRLLAATSTLAAGVNLPAGRVIIRSINIGRDMLSSIQYRQMCGRAGRAGYTDYGESFVVVKSNQLTQAMKLCVSPLPDIKSQMQPHLDGGRSILKVLVELFALGMCGNMNDVHSYMKHTMLFKEVSTDILSQFIADIESLVKFLITAKILCVDSHPHISECSHEVIDSERAVTIRITRFGRGIFQSGLNPDEAIVIYEDLIRSREIGLNLETNVQILYLVTTLTHNIQPNFTQLWKIIENLRKNKPSDPFLQVCSNIGIDEGKLFRWTHQPPSSAEISSCTDRLRTLRIRTSASTTIDASGRVVQTLTSNASNSRFISEGDCIALARIKRFWASCALNMLLECKSETKVAKIYDSNAGDVIAFRNNCCLLNARVLKFCKEIGWISLENIFKDMQASYLNDKIFNQQASRNRPEIETVDINGLTPRLVKMLISNSILSVAQFVKINVDHLVQMIQLDMQFEVEDVLSTPGVAKAETVAKSNDDKTRERLKLYCLNVIASARLYIEEQVPQKVGDGIVGGNVEDIYINRNEDELSIYSMDEADREMESDGGSDGEWDEGMAGYMHEETAWRKIVISPQASISNVNMQSTSATTLPLGDLPIVGRTQDVEGNYTVGNIVVSDLKSTPCKVESVRNDSTPLLPKSSLNSSTDSISDDLLLELLANCENGLKDNANNDSKTECNTTRTKRRISFVDDSDDARNPMKKGDANITPHINGEQKEYTEENGMVDQGVDMEDFPPSPDNMETPHHSFSRYEHSPYLTPFTPSKHSSPGKFLYIPQTSYESDPVVAGDVILAYNKDPKSLSSFGWKNIAMHECAIEFLCKLRDCKCISFDFVFRSLPIATFHNLSSDVPVSTYAIRKAWVSLIAWSPGCKSNNDDPQVLTGISFSFGDSIGYYLPLPTMPPLPTYLDNNKGQFNPQVYTSCTQATLDALPSSAHILICRYVGFETLFKKCPYLYSEAISGDSVCYPDVLNKSCFPKNHGTRTSSLCAMNPLCIISKKWTQVARYAMRMEWLNGCCVEWRLCAEIMRNKSISKISSDLPFKLTVLRERDILLDGHLEDPKIAHQMLEQKAPFELRTPLVSIQSSHALTPSYVSIIACSYRAVALMRVMQDLEIRLVDKGVWNIFMNIEMPLCYCIGDAQLNGIPCDSNFFVQLRQNIYDRIKIIEYYFTLGSWSRNHSQPFNVNSATDVSNLKKTIKDKVKNHVESIIHRNAMNENKNLLCNLTAGVNPIFANTKGKHGTQNQFATSNEGSMIESRIDGIIEAYCHHHPMLKLVSECRSYLRLGPLCSSVLGVKYKGFNSIQERVRAHFNSIGTETGRVIITSPPLQQISHECTFVESCRRSIYDEIASGISDGEKKEILLRINEGVNSCSQPEWVYVHTPLSLLCQRDKSLRKTYSWNVTSQSGCESDMKEHVNVKHQYLSSNGKLVGILADKYLNSTINDTAAAYPHICVDNYRLQQTKRFNISFADVWKKYSDIYSMVDVRSIPLVLVEMGGDVMCYPADKVYRLNSSLTPNNKECKIVQDSFRTVDITDNDIHELLNTDKYPSESAVSQFVEEKYNKLDCIPRSKVNPRDGFRASKGHAFVVADYSQIELRILAHFSMDKKLMEAFTSSSKTDIFKSIAAQWMHKNAVDVTKCERDRVKQLCYALLYGAGPVMVAEGAGCTVGEAEVMIRDFLQCYNGITRFMNTVKASCRKLGYVETMLGRRRHLPGISSSVLKDKTRAERQAVNTVCQGSAADLIKLAMVNIHYKLLNDFKSGNFHRGRKVPGGGLYEVVDSIRLVLQVHDELVFEVPEKCISEMACITKYCMEHAVELNVPLEVKLSVGSTYGNLQPYVIDEEVYHTISRPCSQTSHGTSAGEHMPIVPVVRSDNGTSKSSVNSIARCIFGKDDEL